MYACLSTPAQNGKSPGLRPRLACQKCNRYFEVLVPALLPDEPVVVPWLAGALSFFIECALVAFPPLSLASLGFETCGAAPEDPAPC